MDLNEFRESWERQHYDSLEQVFELASLSDEEKNIFIIYKKYCEYYLLRAKYLSVVNPFSKGPCDLKVMARLLINLNHNDVQGPREHYVKELFSDKSIHQFIETKNGLRSKRISPKIPNTMFELLILSFFLSKGYSVDLPNQGVKSKKIPEFKIMKNDIEINIEAKKLDYDKILDKIFGDRLLLGIDYRPSSEELDEAYLKIKTQFQQNYDNAINKLDDIDKEEYYLIFIDAGDLSILGKPTIDYINSLDEEWKNLLNLVGVVIPDREKTIFIENKTCSKRIRSSISKDVQYFHDYNPAIVD